MQVPSGLQGMMQHSGGQGLQHDCASVCATATPTKQTKIKSTFFITNVFKVKNKLPDEGKMTNRYALLDSSYPPVIEML
jgi:hypothetical protein